jgi:hypothetical protein
VRCVHPGIGERRWRLVHRSLNERWGELQRWVDAEQMQRRARSTFVFWLSFGIAITTLVSVAVLLFHKRQMDQADALAGAANVRLFELGGVKDEESLRNVQNQLLGDSGWRFGQQPGTDFYSMHGYPVPNWHSLPFDGMTDPLCQSLLPFYTRIARSFGPVMLQEFGTILTRGKEQQDQYLRALLPACWDAGANGFLWWCLRDITAKVHPYLKCGFEGYLGLVDAQDRVKPGLEFFAEFAREVQTKAPPRAARDAIGVYFPQHYYTREEQANPGNEPRTLSRWLCSANFLLRQLGHETRVVRGDGPLDPALRVLLLPGAIPASDEAERLAESLKRQSIRAGQCPSSSFPRSSSAT